MKFTEEEPECRELILSVGHPASYNRCFGQESGWLPRNHYWFVIGRYGSELLGYWKREDPEIYSQIVEQARTRMGFIRRIIEELGEEPLFAVLDEDHKINDIDRAFIIDVGISDCSFDEGEEPPEFDFSVDTFYRFRKS